MKKTWIIVIVILFLLGTLACGSSPIGQATSPGSSQGNQPVETAVALTVAAQNAQANAQNAVFTQAAQTVSAMMTQTAAPGVISTQAAQTVIAQLTQNAPPTPIIPTIPPPPPPPPTPSAVNQVIIKSRSVYQDNASPAYTATAQIPYLDSNPNFNVEPFNQEADTLVNNQINQFKMDAGGGDPSMGKSTMDITFTIQNDHLGIASILFNISEYIAGAAHPFSTNFVINFDFNLMSDLSLSGLFQSGANYQVVLANYCTSDLTTKGMIDTPVSTDPSNFKNWNIRPDGIQITFSQYQIAPGAAGTLTVLVPYAQLTSIVNMSSPLGKFYGEG